MRFLGNWGATTQFSDGAKSTSNKGTYIAFAEAKPLVFLLKRSKEVSQVQLQHL